MGPGNPPKVSTQRKEAMSFRTQATLADDYFLQRRIAACAALEGIPHPMEWTQERAWTLSAQPGWDAAYETAVQVGNTAPGSMETVITDGMILAAVQALKSSNASDGNPGGQS